MVKTTDGFLFFDYFYIVSLGIDLFFDYNKRNEKMISI
jgi:hypothetical protein